MPPSPLAIDVDGVHKTFRIPTHRVETFKERVTHPFRSVEYKELRALEDVSCEVKAGEFVGIAGRNGSGKTTLLKLLASIYRPDRGRIRMAGRVAPFIELGVGFNPDLAAGDNIMLNGVMMGLTPKEARTRFDSVIEFAELEDFVELKLKNYSSGMRVRLGFAMLVEADADILLIDEVLAVGDASFQQKCTDTFYDFQRQGRTIVLVTHAMEKLKEYCDRAILLHEGHLDRVGDPEEVGDRYLELNFKREADDSDGAAPAVPTTSDQIARPARILDFWFEDSTGQRAKAFKHGDPIHFCAEIDVLEALGGLCFGILIVNAQGIEIAHVRSQVVTELDQALEPGERLRVRGEVENQLASGRYSATTGLTRHVDLNDAIDMRAEAAQFLVWGAKAPGGYSGVIAPSHDMRVERERAGELASR